MKQTRTVIKSHNVPTTKKRVVETVISRRPRNGRKAKATEHREIITYAPVSRGISNVNSSEAYIIGSGKSKSKDYIDVAYKGYIKDVLSPGPGIFGVTSLDLNPGLKQSFPWIADMANLYEAYTFLKLDFEFQSAKGTQNDGKWYAAVDFDANDSTPVDKATMMSFSGAVDSNIWNHMKMKCSSMGTQIFERKYTRAGTVTGDLKTYDVGKLLVGSQSNAGLNTLLGEVHVDLVVRLMIRQLNTAVSNLPTNTTTLKFDSSGVTGGKVFAPATEPMIQAGPKEVCQVDMTETTMSALTLQTPGEYLINLGATVFNDATDWVNGITFSYPAGGRFIADLIDSSTWFSDVPNSVTKEWVNVALKYVYNSTFSNNPQGIDITVNGLTPPFAGQVKDTVIRVVPSLLNLLPEGYSAHEQCPVEVKKWREGDREYLQLCPKIDEIRKLRAISSRSPLSPASESHLGSPVNLPYQEHRGAATSLETLPNYTARRI